MLNTEYISNAHIDAFIENLASHSVKPEDIANYLDYSVQFETYTEMGDKIATFDNFLLDFRINYPELSLEMEEEIDELYSQVLVFYNIDYQDTYEISERMSKEFGNRFHQLDFQGTFFDLGKEIGLIVGKYINNQKLGLKTNDFLAGLEEGIKIYQG